MYTVQMKTTISTKGQVVLPRAVRDQPGFAPGAELEVRVENGNVVLIPAPLFKPSTLDDLIGCVSYDGPPLTIEQMDQAIEDEIAERHARGRY